VWFAGRDELELARQAEVSGDLSSAVEHFQYAARWYLPGADAPVNAVDALWRIGQTSEQGGNDALALKAYRRMRGAILATRSLYSPFGRRLDAVNDRIANLTADEQLRLGQPTIRDRSRAQLVSDHRSLLEDDPTPSAIWSLLVVLAFLGWVGGSLGTIFRGLDRDAKLVQSSFRNWLGFTVVSFAFWLLALSQA
jgi:hypothetical protein